MCNAEHIVLPKHAQTNISISPKTRRTSKSCAKARLNNLRNPIVHPSHAQNVHLQNSENTSYVQVMHKHASAKLRKHVVLPSHARMCTCKTPKNGRNPKTQSVHRTSKSCTKRASAKLRKHIVRSSHAQTCICKTPKTHRTSKSCTNVHLQSSEKWP